MKNKTIIISCIIAIAFVGTWRGYWYYKKQGYEKDIRSSLAEYEATQKPDRTGAEIDINDNLSGAWEYAPVQSLGSPIQVESHSYMVINDDRGRLSGNFYKWFKFPRPRYEAPALIEDHSEVTGHYSDGAISVDYTSIDRYGSNTCYNTCQIHARLDSKGNMVGYTLTDRRIRLEDSTHDQVFWSNEFFAVREPFFDKQNQYCE